MTRFLLAAVLLLGAVPAFAARPNGLDALMQRYDASQVAEGKIQVTASGDVAWVSGTSPAGAWLEVWRHTGGGRWRRIAEAGMSESSPIRFGVKRDRSCRRTS